MRRTRSRILSLIATCALVVSMMPIGPASGAVLQEASDPGARPVKDVRVKTSASRTGINVNVTGLGADVTGFDVYRSTAAGEEGVKLNDEPVGGSSFKDESAAPGVQYYYTVKVVSRRKVADAMAERSSDLDVFGQVKADVVKAAPSAKTTRAASERERKVREEPKMREQRVVDPAKAAAVSAAAITRGVPDTNTPVSGTWSGSVFVRGDIVVPAGKTLTIKPGTKVYFDTVGSETNPTHDGFSGDPTPLVDLIVHGKLVAAGTSTSPIVFTSVNSYTTSATTDGLPDVGDWGAIFNDSKAASVMSYCRVEYGDSVWSHGTNRPYISSCNILEMAADYGWAGIFFENPVADSTSPRLRITNSNVASDEEGIWCNWEVPASKSGSIVMDPYIVGNTIRAPYPIDFEMYGESGGTFSDAKGNYTLKGTVSGNKCYTDEQDALYVWLGNGGVYDVSFLTAFSNNTFVSTGDTGAYIDCETYGVGGVANVAPTFSGDKFVSGADWGVELYAYANADTATNTAGAAAVPRFTNCTITSNANDAIYMEADSDSAGTANCSPVFSGGSFAANYAQGGDTDYFYGVYTYADSDSGNAYASPSFTKVNGRATGWYESYDRYGVYSEAYAYAPGKVAKANPKWVGGQLASGWGTGIYAYADSNEGNAEAKPYIAGGAVIRSEDVGLEMYAYGGNDTTGTSDVSATLLDSTIISTDDSAIYGYAYGMNVGNAYASPYISNCSLTAENYYPLELYAYTYEGSAYVNPKFYNSTAWGYDAALYGQAERFAGDSKTFSANVSPSIKGSTLFSKYDYVMQLEANNDAKGNASVKPTISASDIINGYDYQGIYARADVDATGTAEVSPVMSASNVKSDYECLDIEAQGDGAGQYAKANGTFTDCTFTSSWDSAAMVYALGYGGGAENKPVFTRCAFDAPYYYGYEGGVEGYAAAGTTFTAGPVFNGGSMGYTGDGIYTQATNRGDLNSGNDAAYYLNNTKVNGMPIDSLWDYGVYTEAITFGTGNANNYAQVLNSPIKSWDGIEHDAACFPNWWVGGMPLTSGTAKNQSVTSGTSTKRMGVESYDGTGVYNYTYSYRGAATDLSQVKYLTISSGDEAVYNDSRSGGNFKSVTSKPTIASNVTTSKWTNDASAIYVEGDATEGSTQTADVSPVISGNSLGGSFNDAIYVWGESDTTKVSPTIKSNSVATAFGNGIYVGLGGTADPTSFATVTRNKVDKPQLCNLFISEVPGGLVEGNNFTNPGWYYQSNDQYDTSCIYWASPDYAKATVRGNTLVGSRSGAVYYGGGAAKTEYNSFMDASGNSNRPFNYWTDENATNTVTPYSARYNWWGTTSSAAVSSTVNVPAYAGNKADIVNFGNVLPTRQPKVTSIGVAKSATKVTFTVKFDRPMDTAIKTLKFGKSSPYSTYGVNGAWYKDGAGNYTIFKGTRARAGLPTGVNLYFSGAKDLPGNTMLSTSKAFKL